MKVLNFGSLNLDYVYQVDRFVRPGETLSARSMALNPGGKGLNQSIALARAGAQVYHGGCVGKGGEALRELLRENGVNTELLLPTGQPQGSAVIQVTSQGENCILLYGGSNQALEEGQIQEALGRFQAGDCLVLQNEVNHLPLLVEEGARRGLLVVLNPSPYDERLAKVDFGQLSWLLVNEVEAEQIAGSQDPDTVWKRLHSQYPGLSLVVTLGGQGSAAFRVQEGGVEALRQAAVPVRPVDTTAAGDTFTGYFIAGLAQGLALKDAMARASQAAAISVTRPGAAGSIPRQDEVERAGL